MEHEMRVVSTAYHNAAKETAKHIFLCFVQSNCVAFIWTETSDSMTFYVGTL